MIDKHSSKEQVLAAVTRNGSALYYAHPDLKKDKKVVLVAVTQNGEALSFADPDLRKDLEVVLAAVKPDKFYYGQDALRDEAFSYAHDDLRKDKEAVLAVVNKNGNALQFAHDDLKKDKKVVLAAVTKNGEALQFAHEDLKKDKEIVLAAVTPNGRLFQYAHEDLKKDKAFILEVVKANILAFEYIHDDLKKDKYFMVDIVKANILAFECMHDTLKKDWEFIHAVSNQFERVAILFPITLRKHQNQLELLVGELNRIVNELEFKATGEPEEYGAVAKELRELFRTLSTEKTTLSERQTIDSLTQFNENCNKALDSVKHGYVGTFFGTHKTDTSQRIEAFNKKFQSKIEEMDSVISLYQ